ncbi:2-nitropropane dioxygenase [Planctomycetaceae bacterium SCGC AG-212-F19]|nr:2-nitropropane dioxygenase [Planctomycetaceae bacterium SCGC AG-212-F19]
MDPHRGQLAGCPPAVDAELLRQALLDLTQPFAVDLRTGAVLASSSPIDGNGSLAHVPACRLEHLGDPAFCTDHKLRYAYLAGAMANGIGSADIVEAMGRAGMLAFFGAAGLSLRTIEAAIDRITASLSQTPFGFNLIHTPNEPDHESAVVDLYLRRGVRLVEASAYLDLTLPVVRYAIHGIHRAGTGRIVTPNRVIAKVSRVEVASKFFAPPPAAMLRTLVGQGVITAEQADLASHVPVAQDLTAEADSAGHTDNRPLVALLPTMLALRDRMQAKHGYSQPLRVGAAGGISTPASAAAAFAMGAAYILTGSVNQACVESGSSDAVRQMLAEAEQADVIMAPAADMFEMGVKVQVLKRGTMFAMRAAKLFEVFRTRESLENIPPADRSVLEKTIFRMSIDEVWNQTREFWQKRDPGQLTRAERDGRHKMALVFRWYLGLSSRWANAGEPSRKVDYQVWCGPAMGAFNEWVRGSCLEQPANRRVVTVALNILYGAAVCLRASTLRCQGIRIPAAALHFAPREAHELADRSTRSQRTDA